MVDTAPAERRAMELLFGSLGRNEVTLEDFEEYTKKNLAAFTASWKKWDQEVKESAKVHQFFDPSAKKVLWLLPSDPSPIRGGVYCPGL